MKKRRERRRLRWMILRGITYAEVAIAVLALSAMESPNLWIPIIAEVQAWLWIGLFIKANPGWIAGKGKR